MDNPNAELIAELEDEIVWAKKDLVEALAEGDQRSAKDARAIIKDATEDIAVMKGGTDTRQALDGIHSGDRRYTVAL